MDQDEMRKLLIEISGDVKSLASGQNEIKNSITEIKQKLDTTQKKTDDNSKDIEFINKIMSEYKVEMKEKHKHIYENMDKKEESLIEKINESSETTGTKVKSWLIRGIGTAIGAPIALYLIMKVIEAE